MPPSVTLVVDLANVMGARPDGWWRDRAGAATRLLAGLTGVVGRDVRLPSGEAVRVAGVLAVVEGQARGAQAPLGSPVRVVRAERDGDSAVVAASEEVGAADGGPVVVTADRGLRVRLSPGVGIVGPGWLRELLDAPPGG